jgi:hypothetical protein
MSDRQEYLKHSADSLAERRDEPAADFSARAARIAAAQQRFGNGAVQLKTKQVGSEGVFAALQEFAPPSESVIPNQHQQQNLPTTGGEALPVQLQESLQEKAGTELHDVRIHRGGDSAAALDGLQAEAATQGTNVYLGPDVDLNAGSGQDVLLHELRHVGQQKRGEVAGLDGVGGDPSKRVELERDADKH